MRMVGALNGTGLYETRRRTGPLCAHAIPEPASSATTSARTANVLLPARTILGSPFHFEIRPGTPGAGRGAQSLQHPALAPGEPGREAVSRPGERHLDLRHHRRGPFAQDVDPVRQVDRFVDALSDHDAAAPAGHPVQEVLDGQAVL